MGRGVDRRHDGCGNRGWLAIQFHGPAGRRLAYEFARAGAGPGRTAAWGTGVPCRCCHHSAAALHRKPLHAGVRRDTRPAHHRPRTCPSPTSRRRCGSSRRVWPNHRYAANDPSLAPRPPNGRHQSPPEHPRSRLHTPHILPSPRLNLTFPNSPARHRRAAVQSIDVYLPPRHQRARSASTRRQINALRSVPLTKVSFC